MPEAPTSLSQDEHLPSLPASYAERARGFAALAKAANTRRAYASDFRDFEAWCAPRGLSPIPAGADAVLAFLMDRAESVKVSSLQRRLVAIREAHRYAAAELDLSAAAFRDAWRGLRRDKGAPPNKKAAMRTDELRKVVAALPLHTLQGLRDRSLLLVGFAAALRRSELVSLMIERSEKQSWVEQKSEGLVIHLARSKTDPSGRGQAIAVPFGRQRETCPVRAYRAWLEATGLAEGPAFRAITRHDYIDMLALSDRSVALIIKRAIERAALAEGATASEARARAHRYAGHSLRAGLATSAAANDAPRHAIQRHLRHKKFETTAGYIEEGQRFRQNPAEIAGL